MHRDVGPKRIAAGLWTLFVIVIAVIGIAGNWEASLQEDIDIADATLAPLRHVLKFVLTNPLGLLMDLVVGLAAIFKWL